VIRIQPVHLERGIAVGVLVELPKTRALSISTEKGYVMCGLLDVPFLDELHSDRQVVAARVVGVREIDDLLEARIRDCTAAAAKLGVRPGMTGREALDLML
jgi:uncharacterized protein YunC (DUF1805 family)